MVLDYVEWYWTMLNGIGLCWMALNYVGLHWTMLDGIGLC